ncbi:PAS domain S-box protein [Spirochaetota bacterium]
MKMPSILIIEDEAIIALNIRDKLEKRGYKVVGIANNRNQALKHIREENPDLLLIDIMLDGKFEGIDIAMTVKEDFKKPFLFLTAHSDEKTLKEAKLTEPYGYILKPVKESELYSSIEIGLYKYEMESKLRESEAKLRAIFESSPNAIIVTDISGVIRNCSHMALNVFGYSSKDELVDKPALNLIDISDRQKAVDKMEEAIPNELLKNEDFRIVKKDGHEFIGEISASVIKNYSGDPIGFVSIINDITDRKRIEEEILRYRDHLEERTADLQSANELLQRQIEIRTELEKEMAEIEEKERERIGQDLHDGLGQQLTGIRYLLGQMILRMEKESSPDEAKAREIMTLLDEAKDMVRDLSRGFGSIDLEEHGFNNAVDKMLADAKRIFGVSFKYKSNILIKDRVVATNLYFIIKEVITNSIKHGEPGEIDIRLKRNNDGIKLRVKHNGKRFKVPGDANVGLGLKIINYRLSKMNGTMDILDNPKGGTIFDFIVIDEPQEEK